MAEGVIASETFSSRPCPVAMVVNCAAIGCANRLKKVARQNSFVFPKMLLGEKSG